MTIFIVLIIILDTGKKAERVFKNPSRAKAARIPSLRRIGAAEESNTVRV